MQLHRGLQILIVREVDKVATPIKKKRNLSFGEPKLVRQTKAVTCWIFEMSKSQMTLSNQIQHCKVELRARYAVKPIHHRRVVMGRTVGISIGGLILLLIVVAFVF